MYSIMGENVFIYNRLILPYFLGNKAIFYECYNFVFKIQQGNKVGSFNMN